MAAARPETVRVVVQHFDNDEIDLSDRFEVTATAAEVKRRWAEKFKEDEHWLHVFSEDLRAVDDGARLGDLRSAGAKLLHLVMKVEEAVNVRLWGSKPPGLPIRLLLSCRPTALYAQLRGLFQLSAERRVRLCSAEGLVLDQEQPLRLQGIGGELLLDPGFVVAVVDAWEESPAETRVECFASDTVVPTLVDERDLHTVLLEGGRSVRPGDHVGSLFDSAEQQRVTAVRQRRFSVFTGRRMVERALLPSSIVRSAFPDCSPAFENSVLPESARLASCGLPDDCLISAHVSAATVLLSSGDCQIFRLRGPALVADLHREVAALEESAAFVLTVAGRTLHPEARLAIPDAEKVVVRRMEPIVIHLADGRSLEYNPEHGRTHATYCDLHAAAHRQERKREEGEVVEFLCCGCQRRLKAEWEGRQSVPADCCPTRSLQLRRVSVGSSDVAAQTTVALTPDDALESRQWSKIEMLVRRGEVTPPKDVEGQFDGSLFDKSIAIMLFGLDDNGVIDETLEFDLKPDSDLSSLTRQIYTMMDVEPVQSLLFQCCGHFDSESGKEIGYLQRDGSFIAEHGKKISCRDMSFSVIKPLRAFADVVYSPTGDAVIMMRLNTVFLDCRADSNETGLVQAPMTWESLHNSNVVAWLEGRWTDVCRSQLFIHAISEENKEPFQNWMSKVERVDVGSGEKFEDQSEMIDSDDSDTDVGFVHILLRAGCRLPKWKFPQGYCPIVYVRSGFDLSVGPDGAVRVDKGGAMERKWVLSPSNYEFQKALARTCSQ